MWSIAQLCRCSQTARCVSSKLVGPGVRIGFNNSITRQLMTPIRASEKLGLVNNIKGFRISEAIKSSGVITRFCSSTPKSKPSKAVGYWLLGCSGMVFIAVVLGGVTRLTESGLSMVTWRLLGEKFPATMEEWQQEFNLYQQYPEFKYKNQDMDISEFKGIWWMEWAHRMWGRAVGAAVLLPAAYYWARGRLAHGLRGRVAVYCALVGVQGLMGWYMVRSGLEDRFEGPADVPRVSQYRLAAHLGLAFVLYAGLLAGGLRVLRPAPGTRLAPVAGLRGVTALAHALKAMVFVTAMSGAFVAGLDAGLVYNTFPKMGARWVPSEILELRPALRNLTENPVTVQFDHRVLGTLTLVTATALLLVARRRRDLLSPAARKVAYSAGAMAWIQASLGLSTLLLGVPLALAAAHQAGSLALLSLAVWLTHEVKLLKYIPK